MGRMTLREGELSPAQAAEATGYSEKTIRRDISDGHIRVERRGMRGHIRIKVEALEAAGYEVRLPERVA